MLGQCTGCKKCIGSHAARWTSEAFIHQQPYSADCKCIVIRVGTCDCSVNTDRLIAGSAEISQRDLTTADPSHVGLNLVYHLVWLLEWHGLLPMGGTPRSCRANHNHKRDTLSL